MTNQELIKQIDDLKGLGEISFEQWWAMKNAVETIGKRNIISIYDLPEPPDREEYLIEHAGELERRVVYLQETIIQDARELEEFVRLGERMRAAQKLYFRDRSGANLDLARKLEREFDVAAAKKLDETPKKPTLFD